MNKVPREYNPLIALAVKALLGAQTFGPIINLEHNTAELIEADTYDLTGDPDTPLIPGKQALLNAKNEELKTARAAGRLAKEDAQDFCRRAIALLRPILGNNYNGDWHAAGFLTPSLAVPKTPVPMLLEFRQYFERHPSHENAPLNLTATMAQAKKVALQAAELAIGTAEANRVNAKAVRDAALKKIGERMSDLRTELELLLDDSDGRWYEFGFNRPIDGRIPTVVTGLVLTPIAPGIVGVAWDHSTRVLNYRAKWWIAGGSSPVVELGLFTDRQFTVTDLPSGSTLVVAVSARNNAGETIATEATIVIP